ncbi:hypothetical protein [Microbulbifer sediminum]|uniref:hypothetical protein n=1 Tax=Microbulbifer sediminum TaxID=2904250 RepID=UPI001F1A7D87|nr:hypothetical protein [Microbulbifer sediminum]
MKLILEKLKKIEYDGKNSSFQLTVKYLGQDLVRGWPPALNTPLHDHGIPDPGFGQGPVDYAQVQYILIHADPVWRPLSDDQRDELRQKFRSLVLAIGELPNIEVTNEYIRIENA